MIGGYSVRAKQSEVFDVVDALRLCGVDGIGELDVTGFMTRNKKAKHEGLARVGAALRFFSAQLARGGVEEPGANSATGAILFALVSGSEVAVGMTVREDLPGEFLVEVEAVALAVELVPGETKPLEAFEDGVERRLRVALDVGIVDTENHSALIAAGVEPIKDKGSGAAYMQVTRRRGGEADSGHQTLRIASGRRRRAFGRGPGVARERVVRRANPLPAERRWPFYRRKARGYYAKFCACERRRARRI